MNKTQVLCKTFLKISHEGQQYLQEWMIIPKKLDFIRFLFLH